MFIYRCFVAIFLLYQQCFSEIFSRDFMGDYDVDGITSSLCMSLIFDALGLIYEVYIPRRMTDGYGVSENSLKKAAAYDVIITVDNGITAKELLDKTGKEVYVIDHHQAREDGALPNAKIILDPEVTMDDDFIHYCGVGLVYKIAESLYQKKENYGRTRTVQSEQKRIGSGFCGKQH